LQHFVAASEGFHSHDAVIAMLMVVAMPQANPNQRLGDWIYADRVWRGFPFEDLYRNPSRRLLAATNEGIKVPAIPRGAATHSLGNLSEVI